MTALVCWWHRKVLRHPQMVVMNGSTEPGVWCFCHWRTWPRLPGDPRPARWFPSDGGGGR